MKLDIPPIGVSLERACKGTPFSSPCRTEMLHWASTDLDEVAVALELLATDALTRKVMMVKEKNGLCNTRPPFG